MRTIVFEILSYWQAGSGRGAAAMADSVIVRDDAGLPYLPGRSVKGLLREAMQQAEDVGAVEKGRVEEWFGSRIPAEGDDEEARERQREESRYKTEQGRLWFGSGRLPEPWRRWAAQAGGEVEPLVSELVTYVASTAINRDGVARDQTLRVAQVAVPMTLHAEVHGPEGDSRWVEDLRTALPLLRCLGSRRQRGYGRVRVRMEEP